MTSEGNVTFAAHSERYLMVQTSTPLTDLLPAVEKHIRDFFAARMDEKYVYHDLAHTVHVQKSARDIAIYFLLTEHEKALLEIAAWFHDTGYDHGPQNHETRSAAYARTFLEKNGVSEEDIKTVEGCILATRFPHQPENLLQQVLCDADMAHLGDATYWDRCGRVRQELAKVQNVHMAEPEWIDFEIGFMERHRFFTAAAEELYGERKRKHTKQLKKLRRRLDPEVKELIDLDEPEKPAKKSKKKKKKGKKPTGDLNEARLGRGVETMYRTTYRTHVNLSSIADNKANIMLSVNAIIISIVVSNLVPQFDENSALLLPTGLLLLTCLVSVVFATLSTRPKVTEGVFTRDDIREKKSNLLFFGNFYNMAIDDYHWGMMEMIRDPDFLYSSMTRDLYYLGKVLAKKYRYLSICYGVFMYGLIVSVVAFVFAYF